MIHIPLQIIINLSLDLSPASSYKNTTLPSEKKTTHTAPHKHTHTAIFPLACTHKKERRRALPTYNARITPSHEKLMHQRKKATLAAIRRQRCGRPIGMRPRALSRAAYLQQIRASTPTRGSLLSRADRLSARHFRVPAVWCIRGPYSRPGRELFPGIFMWLSVVVEVCCRWVSQRERDWWCWVCVRRGFSRSFGKGLGGVGIFGEEAVVDRINMGNWDQWLELNVSEQWYSNGKLTDDETWCAMYLKFGWGMFRNTCLYHAWQRMVRWPKPRSK